MPDPVIHAQPGQNRLLDAWIQVADAVTESIIRVAQQTHTPVIVQDEHGQIVRLDANKLAQQYGLTD